MDRSSEILIVGSGAGGSVVASRLASAGKKVTVLEEGSLPDPLAVGESLAKSTAKYYRSAGAIPFLGPFTFPFGEAKVLGGGTHINGGLLWRTPRRILDVWANSFDGSVFSSSSWEESENRVMLDLSVNTDVNADPAANQDSWLLNHAASELAWKTVPVPRAVIGCENYNRCATGCPSGAKQSSLKNYLKSAQAMGAQILPNAKVTKINHSRGKATSVIVDLNGKSQTFEFKTLVLAAGATQSPLLLKKNRISKLAGKSFEFHLNFKVIARFSDAINASNGTIFTHQIQEFEDQRILLMSSNFQSAYVAMGLADLEDHERAEYMRDLKKLGIYVAMVQPHVKASLHSFLDQTFGLWSWGSGDFTLVQDALIRLCEVLFQARAIDLVLPMRAVGKVNSFAEARKAILRARPSDLSGISVHGMSGCRMGDRPLTSVVNLDGLVWNTKNIYVCDSSTLPSSTGESPQGTIMTLAHELVNRWQLANLI